MVPIDLKQIYEENDIVYNSLHQTRIIANIEKVIYDNRIVNIYYQYVTNDSKVATCTQQVMWNFNHN